MNEPWYKNLKFCIMGYKRDKSELEDTKDPKVGDTYIVEHLDNANYTWTGSEWKDMREIMVLKDEYRSSKEVMNRELPATLDLIRKRISYRENSELVIPVEVNVSLGEYIVACHNNYDYADFEILLHGDNGTLYCIDVANFSKRKDILTTTYIPVGDDMHHLIISASIVFSSTMGTFGNMWFNEIDKELGKPYIFIIETNKMLRDLIANLIQSKYKNL